MKQLLFLSVLTTVCAIASLTSPFWGVFLYYTYAVLRPQFLWEWALPIHWRWSLTAAAVVLITFVLNLDKVLRKARGNMMMFLFIAFGLLLLASCLHARNPAVAQAWGVEYAKVMLIALIACLLIDRIGHLRILAVMILICLGYIAYEVNYLYLLGGRRLDIYHYGYGGLDNNGAGLLLAMGIPFAFAFATSGKPAWGIWPRLFAAFLGLVLIHAILMTYSRGAMLASLVGVAWLLLMHRKWWQSALAVAALAVVIPIFAGQEIRDRFFSTMEFESDPSALSRLDSWRVAWDLAWQEPLLGHGIRNAALVAQTHNEELADRAIHSVYLQLAADSGIPVMLLFIAMLLVAMWRFGQSRRLARQWAELAPPGLESDKTQPGVQRRYIGEQLERIALAGQASLVIYAVGSVFLSLEVLELMWLLMVMAGVMPTILREAMCEDEKADELSANAAGAVPAAVSAPAQTPSASLPLSPRPTLRGVVRS